MNKDRKKYMKKWREENKEHIAEYKKEYVKNNGCSYKRLQMKFKNLQHQLEEKEQDIRLDQTKKVFEVLADTINNGSISYRNLIYDKLGFTGHYKELMAGLTITNAIVDLEEKDKIINEAIEYINQQIFDMTIVGNGTLSLDRLLEILERGKNGI